MRQRLKTLIIFTCIIILQGFCSAIAKQGSVSVENINLEEYTQEKHSIKTELHKGNPRPTTLSPLCNKSCSLGFEVCKTQKKEKPKMLYICDERLKECFKKCAN